MFCTNCGSKLPEGAAFCTNCGAKVISDESDIQNQTTVSLNKDISDENKTDHMDEDIPIPDVEKTVIINPVQPTAGDDTQAVFNDIQESLANSEMNFAGDEPDQNMNSFQPQPQPDNIGKIPLGPEGGNEPDQKNDQAPKQKKVLWLILGIVAVAVVVVAVVIAIILMLSPGKRQKDAYENQVTQGEEFIKNSDYDDAIEAFRDAIEIDENEEDAYVGLADAYIKNKEYRKAAEILQRGSKVSGSKERIEEKKEELYNLAPELEKEFESKQEESRTSQTEAAPPSQAAESETTPPSQAAESETTPPSQAAESETTPPSQAAESETTPPSQVSESETTPPSQAAESETTPPSQAAESETTLSSQAAESETTPPSQVSESETTPPSQAAESETTPPSQVAESGKDETASQEESGNRPPEETQESGPQDNIYLAGNFQYELLTYESNTSFDDGSVGGYTKVVYPHFLGNSDGEKAINQAVEAYIDQAGEYERIARELTGKEDYEFPLYYDASLSISYSDHGIISMSFAGISNGGNGSKDVEGGFIFNETDGQILSMSDVLYGSQEDIQALIARYYVPEENDNVPVEQFAQLIFEGTDRFYLTDEGLYCCVYNEENVKFSALIPLTDWEWFRFLSDTDPTQELETSGFLWKMEPSLEFQDMPVIMDDSYGPLEVTAGQYDLAVYEKDGKLGFVDYDGNILSEPLYNGVFSCKANGDQTLFASQTGNDLWAAAAIDPESGQPLEKVHSGHGGNEGILVYARNDGKLYTLFFDGYASADSTFEEAVPVAVVDDIAGADFDRINGGECVYGIYSPEGTVDENHLYDHIYPLSDQRMVALSQGKYGVIDTGGNVVIPFEFDGARYLDFAGISQNPGEVLMAEGQPYPYSEGYIPLKKEGQWGYYDVDGQCVTGMVFEEARPVHKGTAFVKQDGKWGIIEIVQNGEQESQN